MPPFDIASGLVPLLAIDHESQMGFYVGLYGNQGVNPEKQMGIGLRFEIGPPESPHCYPHVQLTCTPFRIDDLDRMLECSDWIPESNPCIPSTAECLMSLLLCLLSTFYGTRLFVELTSNEGIAKLIEDPLQRLFRFAV